MKKIQIGVLALLSCLILLAAGCKTRPIENVIASPIPTSNGILMTMEQIRQGIKEAGSKLGWVMTQPSKGKIIANLNLRGHSVTSEITFDQKSYNIIYKASINMAHDKNCINHVYNIWVDTLGTNIDQALMKKANPPEPVPVVVQPVIPATPQTSAPAVGQEQ